MKTRDEMVERLFDRRSAYEAKQKERRKLVTKLAASAAGVCTAVLLGVGIVKTGVITGKGQLPGGGILDPQDSAVPGGADSYMEDTVPSVSSDEEKTQGVEETQAAEQETVVQESAVRETEAVGTDTGIFVVDPLTAAEDTEAVPTGDEVVLPIAPSVSGGTGSFDACVFLWKNGLLMYGDLYWKLQEAPGAVYAVIADYRPTTGNITDFIYEGKPLSAWATEPYEIREELWKMQDLLKLGEDLKYGPALYETGTPDGIKWDRGLYESTVAGLGDLLDRYIADGVFLKAELERDIAGWDETRVTEAEAAYARAYSAYLASVMPAFEQRLTDSGIRWEKSAEGNLILHVTAEILENLPFENPADWRFCLADGTTATPTDGVLPTVNA